MGFAVIPGDFQHPSENEFCNGKHSQGFAHCSPTKTHFLNVSVSWDVQLSDFLIYMTAFGRPNKAKLGSVYGKASRFHRPVESKVRRDLQKSLVPCPILEQDQRRINLSCQVSVQPVPEMGLHGTSNKIQSSASGVLQLKNFFLIFYLICVYRCKYTCMYTCTFIHAYAYVCTYTHKVMYVYINIQ